MKIVDRCCSRSSAGGVDGIEVRQDGVPVVASATSLDIIDATVADGGDGVAEITIPSSGVGGIEVDEEGALVVAAATALNFVGSSVTVTDGGSGTATITVTSGGGGGLTQTVVSTDQTATAGNLYTFTGLAADRTLTLPASATAGDQVGVCLADLTYSVTVALNGLRYHTFQNNRILRPGYDYGLVFVLTYVDATVGWVSNYFIPASFWDSFATWFDLSDAANATENARIYNRASEGTGAVQGASTFYNKRLQSYRGKRYEGMDFSGGVNSYLNSSGDLVAADHTGNMISVVLFQIDTALSNNAHGLLSKRATNQNSWTNFLSVSVGGNISHGFQVSPNGTTFVTHTNSNYLSLNTPYVGIGYYDGTNIGSVVYGGAYNGAATTTAHNTGIFNGTASVTVGSIAAEALFDGWISYCGTANLTYTAAIGAELGAGIKYPYQSGVF